MAIDPQRMAAIMQRVQLANQGGSPPGGGMMAGQGGASNGPPPQGTVNAPAPPGSPPGTANVGVPMKLSGAVVIEPADGQDAGKPPTQVHIEGTVMMRPIVTGQPSAAPGMAPQGMPPGGMPPR